MNSQTHARKIALARSLINKGNFIEANSILMDLCRTHPDADSLYLLGLTRGQMRDYSSAENLMEQALKLQPDSDVIWHGLGMAQLSQGMHESAVNSFNKCLLLNPKNIQAINSLGNTYRVLGKIDQAENLFNNSLKIQPGNAETLSFLGNIYLGKCMYEEAIKCYKKSVKRSPNYIDAQYNLGCAYQGLGQHNMAIKYYRQAKRLNPASTLPVTAIANSLEKQGKNEEALNQLNPLIDKNILTADVISTFAKVCINTGLYTRGVDIINMFLETTINKTITPILEQEIRFNLGDLYNKMGEFDKAFNQYVISNEMRPYNYNRTAMEDYFASIESAFPIEKVTDLPKSNSESNTPIFIVGMPRSGTSLIEQILASHSEVSGAGELQYITDVANRIGSSRGITTPYPDSIASIDKQLLNEQSSIYLYQIRKHGEKSTYLTDKMPHNFLYIGLIKLLFPKCKIVHCLRDPLDVCLSIYFHNFNSNHPYSDNLENLGHYYNLYRKLMRHWYEFSGTDIFEISYEDLLSTPEEKVLQMLDFLGLEWQDNCMKFYENKRTVSTPSYTQVRQPLYKTSMNRWKNYENHIKDLKNAIRKDYLIQAK